MARIFVSYNQHDSDFVRKVADRLKQLGHDIAIDVDALSPGQDLRNTLANALRNSDVFVVFVSKTSTSSQFVLGEIGAARAYADESNRMLVVPVLIDDIQIPPIIQDLFVIAATDKDSVAVSEKINSAIAIFLGRKAAQDEQESVLSQKIERNSAAYIEEAISLLESLEKRNRLFGTIWYVLGFVALLCGVVFAGLGIVFYAGDQSTNWSDFAVITLKSVVIVGLLAACSKYAFTLGKSYIDESLKSADRMHAISFGKFYLQVFGAKANWPEVKEAFQHWNIDRESNFARLSSSEFDPKLVDSLVQLAEVVRKDSNSKRSGK